MKLTMMLVLSVILVGIFQTGESMADLQDQCCGEKVVNGVTYTRHQLISDEDVHTNGCVNSCGYRIPGSMINFCFKSGNDPPMCRVPSNNHAKFTKEAEDTYKTLTQFIKNKTKEYQELPRSTLKAKIEIIRKDIENYTKMVLNTTSVPDFLNDEILDKIENRPFLMELTEMTMKDFNPIAKIAYQAMTEPAVSPELLKVLGQMEAKMLHQEQKNQDMEQASHHGFQAIKFFMDFYNSSFGAEPSNFLMLMTAIKSNTEQSNMTFLPIGMTRGLAGDCAVQIGGGAVGGAVGGCIVGGVLTAGLGCPEVAAPAAIAGTAVGVAKCLGFSIEDAVGCFSPSSQVETILGMKDISELQLGNFVRTSSGGSTTHFTEFIGWLDRQKSSPVKMLQFSFTGAGSPLTLTASHILFTNNSTKYADAVRPGDRVMRWNGVEMEEQEVTEILPTIQDGFWAPLTRDGTLLVDNILASCYASFPHQIADLALNPVKAFPRYLLDDEQSQYNDGVRSVVKAIKRVGEWVGVRKENGKKTELPKSVNPDERPFLSFEKSKF